jgi:hypothetical protein
MRLIFIINKTSTRFYIYSGRFVGEPGSIINLVLQTGHNRRKLVNPDDLDRFIPLQASVESFVQSRYVTLAKLLEDELASEGLTDE